MPFYDFQCKACKHEFNVMASMADKAEARIPCPECGAQDLKPVYKTAPAYIKGGKEAACPNSHVCGAGCPHAHG